MSATVSIVNWNNGTLLAECLRHSEAQTVQPKRVLVVDNASSDDSATSAEEYVSEFV